MRSRAPAFTALLAALVIASCSRPAATTPPAPAAPAPVPVLTVTVLYVAGGVEERRQGAWAAASAGDVLSRGDAVRAAKDGECQLAIGDLAVVSIGSGTTVELE